MNDIITYIICSFLIILWLLFLFYAISEFLVTSKESSDLYNLYKSQYEESRKRYDLYMSKLYNCIEDSSKFNNPIKSERVQGRSEYSNSSGI